MAVVKSAWECWVVAVGEAVAFPWFLLHAMALRGTLEIKHLSVVPDITWHCYHPNPFRWSCRACSFFPTCPSFPPAPFLENLKDIAVLYHLPLAPPSVLLL